MLVRWGCGSLLLLVCPRYSVAMERECVFLKTIVDRSSVSSCTFQTHVVGKIPPPALALASRSRGASVTCHEKKKVPVHAR